MVLIIPSADLLPFIRIGSLLSDPCSVRLCKSPRYAGARFLSLFHFRRLKLVFKDLCSVLHFTHPFLKVMVCRTFFRLSFLLEDDDLCLTATALWSLLSLLLELCAEEDSGRGKMMGSQYNGLWAREAETWWLVPRFSFVIDVVLMPNALVCQNGKQGEC